MNCFSQCRNSCWCPLQLWEDPYLWGCSVVLSSTPKRGLLGSLKQSNIPFKHGSLDTVSTPSYNRFITFLLGPFSHRFRETCGLWSTAPFTELSVGTLSFWSSPTVPPIINNILQRAHIICHVSRSLSPWVLDSCFIIWKFLNHI